MPEDDVRRVPDDEIEDHESLAEDWYRFTSEPDVRGVSVTRLREGLGGEWQVFVAAAEFVREEPLESEMRSAIDAALRSVNGVTDVTEGDREVWIVQGNPSGGDLTRAAAGAVDMLADRIRLLVNPSPDDLERMRREMERRRGL